MDTPVSKPSERHERPSAVAEYYNIPVQLVKDIAAGKVFRNTCFKKIMDTPVSKPSERPIVDIKYPKGYEG